MNRTPHTSQILVFHSTHFNVARSHFGSRCLARTSSMYHPHDVVLILLDSPLCTLHRLSHLHLPCGLVRGEVHCALPRMKSKALWPTTILSHTQRDTQRDTHRETHTETDKHIRVFPAMVNSNMDRIAKRRWSSNPRPLEENTLIPHCKTTYCYSTISPSTSIALEAHTIRTRSLTQD